MLRKARQQPLLTGVSCGAVRLRADGDDSSTAGEPLLPLRGGMLRGTCLTDGFGGSPPETDAGLIRHLLRERSHLGRAVTAHDLEWIACGEMHDIVQLRCIWEGDTLLAGILLRDTACHAAAFALRAEALAELLKQTSPAEALGLDIRVREPSFYPLHISLWVQSESVSYQTVCSVLTGALSRFLHPVTGNFHGRGWRMGSLPTQNQLVSCVQAALPGVRAARMLVTARTSDGQEIEAVHIHDPFSLPLNGIHHIHALEKGGRVMNPIRLGPTDPQELYARACAQMAEALPGWNDDYPSDPAVAILELFALLASAQEIALDQVTEQHYHAYLRLLGGTVRARRPAQLLAVPAAPVALGQRVLIGGLPFEVESIPQHRNAVVSVSAIRNGTPVRTSLGTAARLEGEWQLEIRLAVPAAAGEKMLLWCGILPEPGRVPPGKDTPAPFRLRGRIFHQGGWTETELTDYTCGFLKNGFLEITPPVCGERLRLFPDGETEGVPRLSVLAAEPVTLVQRRTRSAVADLSAPFRLPDGWEGNRVLHYFLPAEDGWQEADYLYPENGCISGFRKAQPSVLRVCAAEPDFRLFYPLHAVAMEKIQLENETGILPESLRLMAESNGVWKDVPVCAPQNGLTLLSGCRWDEEAGTLCFGDGRDFRIPAEGRLLVCACACTAGAAANGVGDAAGDEPILTALSPAVGGTQPGPHSRMYPQCGSHSTARGQRNAGCILPYPRPPAGAGKGQPLPAARSFKRRLNVPARVAPEGPALWTPAIFSRKN